MGGVSIGPGSSNENQLEVGVFQGGDKVEALSIPGRTSGDRRLPTPLKHPREGCLKFRMRRLICISGCPNLFGGFRVYLLASGLVQGLGFKVSEGSLYL